MKYFMKDHPLITLLIIATICETAIDITRVIKGEDAGLASLFKKVRKNSDIIEEA